MRTGWTSRQPRRVFLGLFIVCVGMLGFGLYLQHVVGLIPCPMCIVQRYALIAVAAVAGLGSALQYAWFQRFMAAGVLIFAGGGAFVAARQSWLQWYPPEVVSCGRDFYGMIENFPIGRAIPMIFRGSGDCAKVDWVFMGLSLANWSFISFVLIVLLGGLLMTAPRR